ncbi:adenine-specific DNA-methyltransferase [Natronocella acetinitrilica]|uniref:site-specific DNA-methyltransferase (adenine-specific) n=1 Tax=Natronocella acetinitrilica TaxID=414046 RepID=A0AAE3G339_9GAMM|nr:adenine-specific DNA-methyltransferase [Natronocella acetinitrilica]
MALTRYASGKRLTPVDEFLPFVPDARAGDDLGAFVASLEGLDALQASLEIGRLYTACLPREHRARFGVYFTPPVLIDRLVSLLEREGVDWAGDRVLDPACGGGAFLIPAIRAVRRALPSLAAEDLLEHIAGHVRGQEIDPFSAWLSQAFVDLELSGEVCSSGVRAPRIVHCLDTLRCADRGRHDVVIGNPPYGRVALDGEMRDRYRASIHGHANLYGLFLHQATEVLAEKGIIGFITPTGFMGGRYFSALRRHMAEVARPAAFELVDARRGVFDDVLQEVTLSVFSRRKTTEGIAIGVLDAGETTPRPIASAALPADGASPWLLPRTLEQAEILAGATCLPGRLADIGYRVSTGPLVWNRHRVALRAGTESGARPIIWADTIGSQGAPSRHAATHIVINEAAQAWLLDRAPCVLVKRTTAREQARRIVAEPLSAERLASLGGAVVVENHVNVIRPTGGEMPATPRALAAFLNTRVVDLVFRCISGSVAVSAYELEAMPVPGVACFAAIESILARGAGAAEVESLVRDAYAGRAQ